MIQQIPKIRIGNTINVGLAVMAGGQPRDLTGLVLTVVLVDNRGSKARINGWTITGEHNNVIRFTLQGFNQNNCGIYKVIVYENANKPNQAVVDSRLFELVRESAMEEGVDSGLIDKDVDLQIGGILIGGRDGTDGVGIASIVQTEASTASGGRNVWRVVLTNGNISTFTLYNGNSGELTPEQRAALIADIKAQIETETDVTWPQVQQYVQGAIGGLYTKPSGGIPKSDLSSEVQTSLGKADTALQSHQDISGKQDVISDLATIRSGAALGATAIQQHQDISGKQDVISDLATIRSGASAGATALQPNDLADWAKQPTRPTYTANDTGALPNTTTLADLEDATHKTVTPTEKATWNAKQDALVSGTNIKTINNESVVGSGNINISGGDGPYYGTIDSSSTATALTATVEGLTELKAGTMVYIRNAVRDGNSSCTLNVNNLGALPIYRSDLANSRTGFNTNTSWIFVYNPSRVEGGCWDQQWGKYEYVNLGYYDRESEYSPIAKEGANRSCIAFTYSETEILPICNNYVFTTLDFDPFGQIYHLNANNTIAGNSVTGSNLYLRNVVDLRYIIQSAANYLTPNKKVYLQCEPLVDGNGNRTGRVRISTATACPLVQELPTTADGYVYIYLGALGAQYYQFRLQAVHPVYEYRNNGIKLWIGD